MSCRWLSTACSDALARFDVFGRPDGAPGLLLQVQSDVLDGMDTRVVVPLMPPDRVPRPTRDLHPVFEVDGAPYVMVTQLLGALPRHELRRPIASLSHERDAVTRALDLLLAGF